MSSNRKGVRILISALRSSPFSLVIVSSLTLTASTLAGEPVAHLVAAMPKHFPPIYSVSRNNVPTGYGVAFMELVAKHAELDIEYHAAASWPLALKMIHDGEADIIPNFGVTPGRMDAFAFTKPYDHFDLSIFVKSATQEISGLDDLKGNLVGVVQFNRGESLLANTPDIDLVTYGSLGQLVAALNSGEVDAAVYPSVIFENFTMALQVANSFKKVGDPLEVIDRAIAVRKQLSELIPLLNRGIDAAMASPEYTRIYERWHPNPPPFWTTRRVLMLTTILLAGFLAVWFLYRYSVTRRFNKDLIRQSNLTEAILNATSDGIVTVNADHHIVSMNAFAETLFSAPQFHLRGRPISELIPSREFLYLLNRILNGRAEIGSDDTPTSTYSLETLAVRSNAEPFPVRIGLARMNVDDSASVVCTVHDESRIHQAEKRADQLIKHDPLTGVLNQRGLSDALSNTLGQDVRNIYCFCIGLTHLTQINSLYGRHIGDNVLVQVASALSLAFADNNQAKLCRSSGNRIILTITNPVHAAEDIARSIADVIKALQVFPAKGINPLTIDFALGVALFPEHASNADDLIDHAEIAYVNAKQDGSDNYCLYAPEVKLAQTEMETAYQRVKSALNDERVVLHFQPIQTIHSRQIHHYEALVRMFDEDGALIMPADIIPVAEQSNLITQIDYKVMRLALQKLSILRNGRPDIAISVNLSAKHFGNEKLYELIQSDMSRHGIRYANLIFEITETAALQNFAAAKEFMNNIRQFGCRFALDDFGVGFTSFAQLRTLPVDLIKIDGMFIKELHVNRQDQVFVKAMSDVAHSLGKKVVAEFVENEETMQYLKEYGVDYAQGFHIGRAKPELPPESYNTMPEI